MRRKKALELINDLYGLESCYVQAAIDELGESALSDQAVTWIADQQLNEERRKGQWMERVAAYQNKHPHLVFAGLPPRTSRWACNKQGKRHNRARETKLLLNARRMEASNDIERDLGQKCKL